MADAKIMASDEGDQALQELAEEEIQILEGELVKLEDELKILLIPKDPNDAKNVIIEIKKITQPVSAHKVGCTKLPITNIK